jgi:hypothetical protein
VGTSHGALGTTESMMLVTATGTAVTLEEVKPQAAGVPFAI